MLVFNRNGRFQRRIGSIGEGPGEVIEIKSFVVNERLGWIAIFNPANHSILLYSFQGYLIREFAVEKSIVRLAEDPNDNLICLSVDVKSETIGDSRLIFLSPEGIELQKVEMYKITKLKERLSMSSALQIIWEEDGSMEILEAPFEWIYKQNPNKTWKLKPGFNPGVLGSINAVGLYGNYYLIQAINPELHFFVASKVTRKVVHCSNLVENSTGPDIFGMVNYLDGGLVFWPKARINNKKMIGLFDSTTLIDYAKGILKMYGGAVPHITQVFRDMTSRLTYEDNPVVAVVSLK